MEEGEEVDEDVPSLLSLEETNGGDHLLLGEVMIHFINKLDGSDFSLGH